MEVSGLSQVWHQPNWPSLKRNRRKSIFSTLPKRKNLNKVFLKVYALKIRNVIFKFRIKNYPLREKVVPINKNKVPEIDSLGFMCEQLESFPNLEKKVLQLSLGLGEPFEILHTTDEIAEILNESKKTIEKNLATGMKRMSDICNQERIKQENEDAYNEIRLQMHNRVIKKLRSLKDEWKLENISQVTERIMLAFFKNDIWDRDSLSKTYE